MGMQEDLLCQPKWVTRGSPKKRKYIPRLDKKFHCLFNTCYMFTVIQPHPNPSLFLRLFQSTRSDRTPREDLLGQKYVVVHQEIAFSSKTTLTSQAVTKFPDDLPASVPP